MSYDINWWGVLAGGVIMMVLGMFWYSQLLFGKRFMQLMNVTDESMCEEKQKGMGKIYTMAFISNLVMVMVLGFVLGSLSIFSVGDALRAAFWIWLGFIAAPSLSGVLFEGRKWGLYCINAGYSLAGLLLVATSFALWF